MDVIRKLAEHVIDQIKAGEVVERPLSVVKELVENALDAGASEVDIELLDGGKKLIRISDNGSGMSETDLVMSLERHATSKLQTFTDLEKISSFGFRGEAIPSIAAVSRFSMRSRKRGAELGAEVEVVSGEKKVTRHTAMNEGTVVTVKDIFETTPARQKFLKSTATEFSQIYDFVFSLAFAYPKVSFRLSHNGRQSLHFKKSKTLHERFESSLEVGKDEFASVDFKRGSFEVKGFASLPEFARPLPKYFITFVNGRLVKDKVIRAGVMQAYSGLLMKGLAPSAILFISMDPKWVDVNAHPAKTEIRYQDPLAIQDFITMAVQNAVKEQIANKTESLAAMSVARHEKSSPRENTTPSPSRSMPLFKSPQTASYSKGGERFAASLATASPAAQVSAAVDDNSRHLFDAEEKPRSPLVDASYLGQYLNCYLLLQVESELWVVDQHAFHERVLFEEFIKSELQSGVARQQLLTPLCYPIVPELGACVLEVEDACEKLGFEIELDPKGEGLLIHSLPALIGVEKALAIFEEVVVRILALSDLGGRDVHPLAHRALNLKTDFQGFDLRQLSLGAKEVYHLLFATMACHAAVRAGEPLSQELVRRLLLRSRDVDFYAHCPHGRPVLRKFTEQDVSQWFLRT